MSRSNDLILHRMKTIRLATIFLLAIVAIACQKQSTALTVEPSEVLLYSGGTKQLTAEPAEGVTYSSKDEFYAEVDASGLVTGNKVGETDIVASSSNGAATIPVTIMPQYSLYPELDPIVNASKSAMIEILGSGYTESTSDKGETLYAYKNYNTYAEVIFAIFSNDVCKSIGVLVSTSYLTKFTSYLKERYAVAGMQNDYYFLLNHDKDIVISLGLYNVSYLLAVYIPYTGTKSAENETAGILERYRNLKFL